MYLFAPARNRPRDQRGTAGTSILIPLTLIFVRRPPLPSRVQPLPHFILRRTPQLRPPVTLILGPRAPRAVPVPQTPVNPPPPPPTSFLRAGRVVCARPRAPPGHSPG